MNAVEIDEAITELAAQPFDAAEFPYAFLAAFGNKEVTIKRLRSGSSNKSDVPGAVLQVNNIHIAACAAGYGRVVRLLLLTGQRKTEIGDLVSRITHFDVVSATSFDGGR